MNNINKWRDKYLVAINLHDKGPYSISTSYIPHVTENGNWLGVDTERNDVTYALSMKKSDLIKLSIGVKLVACIHHFGIPWDYKLSGILNLTGVSKKKRNDCVATSSFFGIYKSSCEIKKIKSIVFILLSLIVLTISRHKLLCSLKI